MGRNDLWLQGRAVKTNLDPLARAKHACLISSLRVWAWLQNEWATQPLENQVPDSKQKCTKAFTLALSALAGVAIKGRCKEQPRLPCTLLSP